LALAENPETLLLVLHYLPDLLMFIDYDFDLRGVISSMQSVMRGVDGREERETYEE
jgi:hypothetical protein